MVAVVAGEVTAPAAGAVYCSVIDACEEISELATGPRVDRGADGVVRSPTWSGDLHRAVPGASGRRSGSSAANGRKRSRRRCLHASGSRTRRIALRPVQPCTASASFTGVRGDDAAAADAYRQASQWGCDPQPGLALAAARPGPGRPGGRGGHAGRWTRRGAGSAGASCCPPTSTVDAGRGRRRRRTARQPTSYRDRRDVRHRGAARPTACVRTRGGAAVPTGIARAALVALRDAVTLWRELDAPYDEARARVAVALACRGAGRRGQPRRWSWTRRAASSGGSAPGRRWPRSTP